jgi:catechol 2,3-dioxygenase-like lactoylglutathione lyase family enzyme
MLHHVSLGTNDLARAARFYDAIMQVLKVPVIQKKDRLIEYGSATLSVSIEKPLDGKPASIGNGTHIAFHALDRNMVDAFHRTALENGGRDEGAPGLRPEYSAHYYAAFVRDPDGHKIEAVTYGAKNY